MTCFRIDGGMSVYRFCKENGYSYSSFFRAMELGKSFDDAMSMAMRPKELIKLRKRHYYKGKAVVDIFGYKTKSYYRYRTNLRKGLSIEDAVEKELERIGKNERR